MSGGLKPGHLDYRQLAGATLALAASVVLLASGVSCAPVSKSQAARAVANWLAAGSAPLGASLSKRTRGIQAYAGRDGEPAYFTVALSGSGFVIVSGDDLVEPIIAFSAKGTFDPSPASPLGALVSGDVPARVEAVRAGQRPASGSREAFRLSASSSKARGKWQRLLGEGLSSLSSAGGILNVSDPRVDPLVQSRWRQGAECGYACYNYYTPPGPNDSPSNYPAGCMATAMAQLMRYSQHPTQGVGARTFETKVCGSSQPLTLRGGNGAGGPYAWSSMALVPDCSTTSAQREAIGALCYDAGVAAQSNYCETATAATMPDAAWSLRNVFNYSNVRLVSSYTTLPQGVMYSALNPNLDASFPIILGLGRDDGGHAVVCDGYGYDSSTMYHHLNLGWGGTDDAWYNLPTVETSTYTYNAVRDCIYNVYVSGNGEIISGRATDPSGNPISGAQVSAGAYTDVTDARGIYALAKIPSRTSFNITVEKGGRVFAPRSVSTGRSSEWGSDTGNVWPVDFTGYPALDMASVKGHPDGSTVGLYHKTVTVGSDQFVGCFYIEELDRRSGIRVTTSKQVSEGAIVDVIGVLATVEGERRINATSVVVY